MWTDTLGYMAPHPGGTRSAAACCGTALEDLTYLRDLLVFAAVLVVCLRRLLSVGGGGLDGGCGCWLLSLPILLLLLVLVLLKAPFLVVVVVGLQSYQQHVMRVWTETRVSIAPVVLLLLVLEEAGCEH